MSILSLFLATYKVSGTCSREDALGVGKHSSYAEVSVNLLDPSHRAEDVHCQWNTD
jgi:hypothetical protein